MENQIHIIGGELLVGDVEGHVFLRGRIDAHGAGHGRIRLLPGLNARGRMQIEGRLQALLVELVEEVVGVGKEQLVPGVAAPAQPLARLIHFALGLELLLADVPAHVDYQHVQRQYRSRGSLAPARRVPGRCSPSSATTTRRRRTAAAAGCARPHAHSRPAPCGSRGRSRRSTSPAAFAGRPLHDPRPGALFAFLEAEIGRIEERPRRVVHQRPAGARDQALPDGLLGLRCPARRPGCAWCPCRFSGSSRPGCQTTGLPSTVSSMERFSGVNWRVAGRGVIESQTRWSRS